MTAAGDSLPSGDSAVRTDRSSAGGAGARVVAIDGPAGTGKSSMSTLLAERVGALSLDTGAMYRAATLAALDRGAPVTDAEAVAAVVAAVDIRVEPTDQKTAVVFLDGREVTTEIRTAAVTEAVSPVSANEAVRSRLVELQRQNAAGRFVVIEGRDIGTVVFPDAGLKIFLTATPEARANRRRLQDLERGISSDFDEVLASVNRRDHLDSTRAVSPLRPADDAIVLDTSDRTIDQVLDELTGLVRSRIGVQR